MMFFVWVGVSIAVGSIASKRFHRDGTGWFFLSCLISPLIAGPLLFLCGPLKAKSAINWNRMSQPTEPAIAGFLQQADAHPQSSAYAAGASFAGWWKTTTDSQKLALTLIGIAFGVMILVVIVNIAGS